MLSSTSSSECGVEGDDVGAATEVFQGVGDLVRGQRADATQILGKDELWPHLGQRVGAQCVQIFPGCHLGADVGVDFGGSQPFGISSADHDGLVSACSRRLVAFEGDPEQIIAETECVHNFGRRGQQRNQAHEASVGVGCGDGSACLSRRADRC